MHGRARVVFLLRPVFYKPSRRSHPWQPLLLTATYLVVIFSIVVQGLTMERVVRRFLKEPA